MTRLRLLIMTAALLASVAAFGQTPRILFFRPVQRSIRSGDQVTLTWSTSGAKSVTIEWRPVMSERDLKERRVGLPPRGTLEDHPLVSTTYILQCTSETGFVCASSSVTVLVR